MTVHKARRAMRDAMRGMYEAQQGHREEARERKAGWTAPAVRRKKIEKNVGEYVKFEELPADPMHPDDGATRVTYTRTEVQITDVEWEDIK